MAAAASRLRRLMFAGSAMERWGRLALAAIVALLVAAPFVVYPVFVMKFMCFTLFAATFNLLMGYAGLMSFGHAAFFGTGAYLTAHAAKVWGVDPVLCLLLSTAAAGVLGLVIGYLSIRRKGIYFSMITLALAQMVAFVALQLPQTGGEDGIQAVPRGVALGLLDLTPPGAIYGFTMVVFALGIYALWRTVNSPFGHVLQAIREHEPRAVSLGYNVARYKLTAFAISAAVAGTAGGLNALVFQLATLGDIGFELSGEVVLMALLGGVGTFFGPFIGAAIVIALQSYLATSELPAPVLIGAVFIVCVLLFRRGVVGELVARWSGR